MSGERTDAWACCSVTVEPGRKVTIRSTEMFSLAWLDQVLPSGADVVLTPKSQLHHVEGAQGYEANIGAMIVRIPAQDGMDEDVLAWEIQQRLCRDGWEPLGAGHFRRPLSVQWLAARDELAQTAAEIAAEVVRSASEKPSAADHG